MSIQATSHIWADGQLVPWNDAVIHVSAHTLHYGSGVFEGIRVYETQSGPAVFRLRDHIERLLHSADTLHMKVPYSADELAVAVCDVLRATGLQSGYIRPVIMFGERYMKLMPTSETPLHVYILCWPWSPLLGDKPVRATITSVRRPTPDAFDPSVKVNGTYVNSINASYEAHSRGFDEAIMLDVDGYITEGAAENIFFVKDDTVFTPRLGNILPGITRSTIVELANDTAFHTKEVHWTPHELGNVSEAFFTGTAAEVSAISEIDNVVFPDAPGPVTQHLRQYYLDTVHGNVPKYSNWLTYV